LTFAEYLQAYFAFLGAQGVGQVDVSAGVVKTMVRLVYLGALAVMFVLRPSFSFGGQACQRFARGPMLCHRSPIFHVDGGHPAELASIEE